ncbi:ABC transporter permease [Clostridium gasigenes]|uniref:Putative ABC transport system permease protein n=1 Tax=Clostridium gasigenes TaxID=94869 RepID=A0A1H0QKT9_9CLOT|nr:FtsX-like permease family protein [Clostridium gasigenes]SDP17298.1 putative ABC transport system permease protein [Clostridium gasigenes]
MINNYKNLSGRYLKKNKKRTILTMIGIILSVALVCCIGTFVVTIQHTMIEEAKNQKGDFHISIKNAKENPISKISNNPKVEVAGLMEEVSESPFVKDKYIKITNIDKNSAKLIPAKLIEGTMPEKNNEIAIEKWALKYLDKPINIGEEIKITDENGASNNYILKGILENSGYSQAGGSALAFGFSTEPTENTTIRVKFKEKVDKKIAIKEFQEAYGIDNVSLNNDVLRLTGESDSNNINKSLFTMTFLIIGIVVFATVFVIYNSFNISISERMRQFGLLRAIGTTKKQVMRLVLREASVMSLIAIPIGLFFGVLALYIVIFVFSKMPGSSEFSNLKVIISPIVLGASTVIGLLSIYISAFLPARSAGRISPLVAISTANLITKEKNKKGGKWLSKIFKIYKVMAIKNVKRNRKRFYITTISMAISVTLFVTFTALIGSADKFTDPPTEEDNIQFNIFSQPSKGVMDIGIDNKIIEEVSEMPEVEKIYKNYKALNLVAIVNEDKISEKAKGFEEIRDTKLEGIPNKLIKTSINFFDKDKLEASKKYVKEGSISNLKANEVIIARDNMFFTKAGIINESLLDVKVGDEILINSNYTIKYQVEENVTEGKATVEEVGLKEDYKTSDLVKVKIAAIVDVHPFPGGVSKTYLRIIAPMEAKDRILVNNENSKEEVFINNLGIIINDENEESVVDAKLKEIEEKNTGIRYSNQLAAANTLKSSNIQMVILLMGFIIVIALISSINIVNTVATNIILRRKELAALKAIGMTDRELRKMITLEGILFGFYGGVIGSTVGTGLYYLFYKKMSGMIDFGFVPPFKYIAIAMISVILIGYISALIPLRRLKKDNIIEAIKEN